MSIVFSDDDDKSWCNPPCDALLIERKDGSHICSYCGREYLPNSVNKHKRRLGPIEGAYDTAEGPELISLTGYTEKRKKTPSVGEVEEKMMASKKSGFSWTNVEEFLSSKTNKKIKIDSYRTRIP